MNLDSLLRFVALTHEFQKIERKLYVAGLSRKENDVEHSYQLALLAWYVVSTQKISLDVDKVIRYAMVHDFVEVFAGDTFFFGERSGKEEREREAALRLQKEYPEFSELHEWIAAYESKADPESLFVYALDKVVPILNIYLDGGRTWKEHGITFEQLFLNKQKVINEPRVRVLFDELMARLRDEAPSLFPEDR
ncbi:MAG: HD domain-containing protein [Patescibacteria group bacterium]